MKNEQTKPIEIESEKDSTRSVELDTYAKHQLDHIFDSELDRIFGPKKTKCCGGKCGCKH